MEVKLEDLRKKRRRRVAKRSRTYYCQACKKSVTFQKDDIMKCKDCSTTFGNVNSGGLQINMRTTLSGTTQMEFSTTTVEESINRMNNG